MEKVVDLSRRVVPVHGGLAWVDDLEAIGGDLVSTVNRKSFKMNANFKVNKYWTRTYECQVGFIRGAESIFRGSPGMTVLYYEVNPVTALHNVNVFNCRDEEFIFKEAQPVFGIQGSDNFNLDFAEGGMDVSKVEPYPLRDHDVSFWNAGLDLTWGDRIAGPTSYDDIVYIMRESSNFQPVRDDFVYQIGQKVGIAVYSDIGPTRKSASAPPNVTDEMLRGVFGKPRRTNIYTGEIVCVGLHHIECSINSFEGCSGAVVFLLDIKQPSSVLDFDWGCAIAVHAGAHSRLDRNVAFKLAAKPRPADSTGN
jgi:hypothetical protein